MNYASHTQVHGTSDATSLAMAMPEPAVLKAAMMNARDGLMIVGYQLMIRVLFLARRWNF
jgi:hypothetical protein